MIPTIAELSRSALKIAQPIDSPQFGSYTAEPPQLAGSSPIQRIAALGPQISASSGGPIARAASLASTPAIGILGSASQGYANGGSIRYANGGLIDSDAQYGLSDEQRNALYYAERASTAASAQRPAAPSTAAARANYGDEGLPRRTGTADAASILANRNGNFINSDGQADNLRSYNLAPMGLAPNAINSSPVQDLMQGGQINSRLEEQGTVHSLMSQSAFNRPKFADGGLIGNPLDDGPIRRIAAVPMSVEPPSQPALQRITAPYAPMPQLGAQPSGPITRAAGMASSIAAPSSGRGASSDWVAAANPAMSTSLTEPPTAIAAPAPSGNFGADTVRIQRQPATESPIAKVGAMDAGKAPPSQQDGAVHVIRGTQQSIAMPNPTASEASGYMREVPVEVHQAGPASVETYQAAQMQNQINAANPVAAKTQQELAKQELENSGKRDVAAIAANAHLRAAGMGLQAGKVPAGYRMRADGSGMEAIPGGPADIGKALPTPAVKELGAAGTAVEDTTRLSSTFKPEYGGHTALGDMSNTFGRLFDDKNGQAQWWQDMDTLQNQTRHALFGSALTKTELAAWEKTSIAPRMNAEQIQQNLARRQEIEARAASKLARSYTAAGYNKQQIAELLGNADQYLSNSAPAVTQSSPRSAPQPAAKASSTHPEDISALLKKYGGK
jgi:hypothetical protein